MKIKGLLAGAAAALMMCTSVFAADPVLEINCAESYEYGYSIKDSTEHYRRTEPNADSVVLLFINGDFILEAEPIIESGATLVPLRIISDKLGAEVSWDSSTKTAYITQGSKTVSATVGNLYITVDGNTVSTTAPTQIINSSTYVPLRAIASAFGAEVGYNAEAFSNSYDDIKVVWVQSRTDSPTVSESEAVQKSKNIISAFYSSYNMAVPNTITYNYAADLGEYYYIKYRNNSVLGVLIDKYDGSFYPVWSYSVMSLGISEKGSYGTWALCLIQ